MLALVASLLAVPALAGQPGRAAPPRDRPERIPFPAKRKQEMRRYALRHYGIDDYRLRNPR